MEIKTITKTLSVTAQIAPSDLEALKQAGFCSVMCNRPDGEGGDQPSFAEISAAAEAVGMQAAYVPVVSGAVSDEDVAAFDAAMQSLPKPVLAFCRTGTRSATLWSLSEGGRRPLAEIL